jgi:hypothetical protein
LCDDDDEDGSSFSLSLLLSPSLLLLLLSFSPDDDNNAHVMYEIAPIVPPATSSGECTSDSTNNRFNGTA